MACNPACSTQPHNAPTAVCFKSKLKHNDGAYKHLKSALCHVKALKICIPRIISDEVKMHITDCAHNLMGSEKTKAPHGFFETLK